MVPVPMTVQVPLPILKVLVPVPVPLNEPDVDEEPMVTLLLLALKSRMQPVVDAVQAPMVSDRIVGLVFTVMVHVVPPTQVAPSNITASADPGTEAPVAPPVVVDHIAVLTPSHVQFVAHTAKRLAASADSDSKQSAMRESNSRFIT